LSQSSKSSRSQDRQVPEEDQEYFPLEDEDREEEQSEQERSTMTQVSQFPTSIAIQEAELKREADFPEHSSTPPRRKSAQSR